MPKEDTQFKGKGLGIPHSAKPIAVKYPAEIEAVLRDESKIPDKSEYIRNAVIKQLIEDGLLPPSDRPPSVPPSESSTDQTSEQSSDTPQKKADRIRNKSARTT